MSPKGLQKLGCGDIFYWFRWPEFNFERKAREMSAVIEETLSTQLPDFGNGRETRAAIVDETIAGSTAPAYRIDQKLHQILTREEARPVLEPQPEVKLPEPVYPQHPDPKEMSL